MSVIDVINLASDDEEPLTCMLQENPQEVLDTEEDSVDAHSLSTFRVCGVCGCSEWKENRNLKRRNSFLPLEEGTGRIKNVNTTYQVIAELFDEVGLGNVLERTSQQLQRLNKLQLTRRLLELCLELQNGDEDVILASTKKNQQKNERNAKTEKNQTAKKKIKMTSTNKIFEENLTLKTLSSTGSSEIDIPISESNKSEEEQRRLADDCTRPSRHAKSLSQQRSSDILQMETELDVEKRSKQKS